MFCSYLKLGLWEVGYLLMEVGFLVVVIVECKEICLIINYNLSGKIKYI